MIRRTATRLAWFLVLSGVATVAVATPSVHVAVGSKPASHEGWPATREGDTARHWVEAFSGGDVAMRSFLGANLSEESLAKKNLDLRMENYHRLREQWGSLVLNSIVSARAGELTASLMASDGSPFEATFELQQVAPYKLKSVTIRQKVAGMHGAFGGFHH